MFVALTATIGSVEEYSFSWWPESVIAVTRVIVAAEVGAWYLREAYFEQQRRRQAAVHVVTLDESTPLLQKSMSNTDY